ncbi:hypothetical protein [Salinarimonas sp.]|uniref:hypothetical protein n=1 Tax=Salinarimonas sp. TaxID=2766526 RepID=UPI0032D98021
MCRCARQAPGNSPSAKTTTRLAEIGGSHAQRDLFDEIRLDALIRTGRLGAAQRILQHRRQASPEAKPAYGELALVYDRLDLPEGAGRMMVRARAAALAHRGRAGPPTGAIVRHAPPRRTRRGRPCVAS